MLGCQTLKILIIASSIAASSVVPRVLVVPWVPVPYRSTSMGMAMPPITSTSPLGPVLFLINLFIALTPNSALVLE